MHSLAASRRDRGFTLLELLVVVVVLGLLMGLAAPLYLGAKRQAYRAAVQSDLRTARVAIEAWAQDQSNGYVLLTNDYFHNVHGMKWRGSGAVELSISTNPASTPTSYCIRGSHPGLPGESWRFKAGVDTNLVKLSCNA